MNEEQEGFYNESDLQLVQQFLTNKQVRIRKLKFQSPA